MKLVVGITGSTGVIYGIRLLEILKRLNIETHLVMSQWAEKCISMETNHDLNYVKSLSLRRRLVRQNLNIERVKLKAIMN